MFWLYLGYTRRAAAAPRVLEMSDRTPSVGTERNLSFWALSQDVVV